MSMSLLGLPTHDKEGKPLSKGASKAVAKEYEKQSQLNEQLAAALARNPEFIVQQEAAIAQLQHQIGSSRPS